MKKKYVITNGTYLLHFFSFTHASLTPYSPKMPTPPYSHPLNNEIIIISIQPLTALGNVGFTLGLLLAPIGLIQRQANKKRRMFINAKKIMSDREILHLSLG